MHVLADAVQVQELVERLGAAVAAARGCEPWAMVGIRSRGDVLAQRLARKLKPENLGTLDITLYRDDLSEVAAQPIVRTTEIPFSVDGLDIVLVDDVLMTGRSVRAALQSLMDLGRPRRVWLAVLVDRGGRELPIAADFVAMDLRTGGPRGLLLNTQDRVSVELQPMDEADRIVLQPAGTTGASEP